MEITAQTKKIYTFTIISDFEMFAAKMNYLRFTRASKYQCVNGLRSIQPNDEPPSAGLPNSRNDLPAEQLPERQLELLERRRVREEQLRVREEQRRFEQEQQRLRQEQQRQAEEKLRNYAILAEVNRLLNERMAQFYTDMNLRQNGVERRMEVDDDDVVLRIPEPVAALRIDVVENTRMLGMRGANLMTGKQLSHVFLFLMIIINILNISVVLKNEKPSVLMGFNSTMNTNASDRTCALLNNNISTIISANGSGSVAVAAAGPSRDAIAGPSHAGIVEQNDNTGPSRNAIAGPSLAGIAEQNENTGASHEAFAGPSHAVIAEQSDNTGNYSISLSSSNPIPLDTAIREILEQILQQIEADELTAFCANMSQNNS